MIKSHLYLSSRYCSTWRKRSGHETIESGAPQFTDNVCLLEGASSETIIIGHCREGNTTVAFWSMMIHGHCCLIGRIIVVALLLINLFRM